MRQWRGVPRELMNEWRAAFSVQSGVDLPSFCPVCHSKTLRRFFGSAAPRDNLPNGFVGLGSCWEWCSSCATYEHVSCFVPTWWKPVKIQSEQTLTSEPGELEKQLLATGYAQVIKPADA